MDQSELVEKMKILLASTFSLSLKAQNYHWNVTGPNFGQYHEFFGSIYTELQSAIDVFAEHIRMLDSFAPGSLKRFTELTILSDELAIPAPKEMFVRFAADNLLLIGLLKECADLAEDADERGLVATLETNLQYHEKLQWMLLSYSS